MTRLAIFTFDLALRKKFWFAFNLCESVPTCKKSVIPSTHSSDTFSFRALSPDCPHSFLTMPTPKIFSHLLICMNLYQHAKNSYFHQFILEMQSILEFQYYIGHAHFWQCLTKKIFYKLLIFVNLYQHAKKGGYFIDLCRNTANNINLIIEQIQ